MVVGDRRRVDGGALGSKPGAARWPRPAASATCRSGAMIPLTGPPLQRELRTAGSSTSRARRCIPGPSAPVAQSTMIDLAGLARAVARRRPRAWPTGPQADAGGMAEQRQLLVAVGGGRPGRSAAALGAAHIARAAAPSTRARCSCQMPSPIIAATAAATRIVGISGSRRIIRRIRPSRAAVAIFQREQQALPTRSPPMVSAAVERQPDQVHPPGRLTRELEPDRERR